MRLMKRRNFIKNSLAGASLPFWLQHCDFIANDSSFPVFVSNDATVGHSLLASNKWPSKTIEKVDTVIVGGGIAGMTAAHQLKDSSFSWENWISIPKDSFFFI